MMSLYSLQKQGTTPVGKSYDIEVGLASFPTIAFSRGFLSHRARSRTHGGGDEDADLRHSYSCDFLYSRK